MNNQMNNYDEIKSGIHQMRQRLAANLSDGDAIRFQSIIMNAIDANPKLAQCSAASVMAVAMLMAQLGLEPGPLGLAYMIPRKGKATFQAGYRGLIQLALRSGEIETIYAHCVRQNDSFKIEFGSQEMLRHTPAYTDRGNVIGYYAVAKMKNGGTAFDFMNIEEVHMIRDKFAYGGKSGPWKDSPTEMGKKTVVKRLTKYLPVRTDYARALSFEGHTIEVNTKGDIQSTDGIEYFDVTDASPEFAVEHIPKIEAPKPATPTAPEKPLDAKKVRVALFASIGEFSKELREEIKSAIKWSKEIESFSDAKIELITQGQLKEVSGVTKYFNTSKDTKERTVRVNALVDKWKAAMEAQGVETRFAAIKELREAAEKLLENEGQIDGFMEAVYEGRKQSEVPEQEFLDITVALRAAEDPKKFCINIMNEWEASQEVAV